MKKAPTTKARAMKKRTFTTLFIVYGRYKREEDPYWELSNVDELEDGYYDTVEDETRNARIFTTEALALEAAAYLADVIEDRDFFIGELKTTHAVHKPEKPIANIIKVECK